MIKLEKIKILSERVTDFLKRKRENAKSNAVINIIESETSELLNEMVIRELKYFLESERGRKLIRQVGR